MALSTFLQHKSKAINHHHSYFQIVQTFYHRKFNHPTLNHYRVRVTVRIRVRVIDSSPLAISSCNKVYITRCLVIKCP